MRQQFFINLAAVAIGLISWGHSELFWPLTVVSLLLPTLWVHTSNRLSSGLTLAGYSLAASRGLIEGAAVFFEVPLYEGALWWLLAGFIWFIGGFLCWHKKRSVRLLLIPVLLVMLILPPVGLVGWTHPITSAGFLFPALGFMGLLLTFFVIVLSAKFTSKIWHGLAVTLVLVSIAYTQHQEPEVKKHNFKTHNTSFSYLSDNRTFIQAYENMIDIQAAMKKAGEGVHWLPESVGGKWTPTAKRYWSKWIKKHSDKQVLLSVIDNNTQSNIIVLVEPNKKDFEVVYKQRFAVPVFSSINDLENIWNYKLGNLNGESLGVIICYEALMVWPVLQTMWFDPDYLLVNGSVYWAPQSILNVQRASINAWGRLFATPVIEAWNL